MASFHLALNLWIAFSKRVIITIITDTLENEKKEPLCSPTTTPPPAPSPLSSPLLSSFSLSLCAPQLTESFPFN